MPTQFLDSQISQNVSYGGIVSIPLSSTPSLFGTLGLNTAGAGTNLSVHFSATVTVSSLVSILVPVTVDIFRVIDGVSGLIYSATKNLPVGGLVLTTDIITVSGIDVPPPVDFLVYQAFVSIPVGIALFPDRVGPESFQATAYSDPPIV